MSKIRVLLADDSSMVRAMLRDILQQADIEVVGEASNGVQAVQLAQALRPDLLTLDLEMPQLHGLAVIEQLMADHPLPILVVSSAANAQAAYAAVQRGALEVISKPEATEAAAAELLAKVRFLAKVPVISHIRPRPPRAGAEVHLPAPPITTAKGQRLVAIAASTGGPQALAQLLGALPASFPCPIVIAQHIVDGFAQGLSEWLDGISPLKVRLAREHEVVMPGTVYLSPSDRHLQLGPQQHLLLRPRQQGDLYRPSCDHLLESVADYYGERAIGLILTGMGSDGVRGMLRLRQAGGMTLAQDAASSVIFGMNRCAIEQGAIQQVLPLSALPGALCQLLHTALPGKEGSR